MVLGLGMESLNRPIVVGETATLFQKAQPRSRKRRLSLLFLYDLTAVGRHNLLAGKIFGQYLVLLSHSFPMLIFAGWAVSPLVRGGALLIASLLFWVGTSIAAMALTVLSTLIIKRPGIGTWLGWLSWPLVVAASYFSPPSLEPFSWLWPFTGFTIAYRHVFDGGRFYPPLALAILGTVVLCFLADFVFQSRPAIWEVGKEK